MKIIGFSGRKGSGKSTAAQAVSQGEVAWIPFAKVLKDTFRKLFVPSDFDWCPDDQDCKDMLLPMGKTVREGLQWFGTDVCRKADPDCWVRAWLWAVNDARLSEFPPDLIIVPDVRFPNELRAIQEMGGHVIRLLRAPHPEDRHETETALDEIERSTVVSEEIMRHDGVTRGQARVLAVPCHNQQSLFFDAVVNNESMTIEQMQGIVARVVTERGWA